MDDTGDIVQEMEMKELMLLLLTIFMSEFWCYFGIKLCLPASKGNTAFMIHTYSVFPSVLLNNGLNMQLVPERASISVLHRLSWQVSTLWISDL